MEELLLELDVKFYCQRCGKETPHREKNLSKRAKPGTWEAYEYIGHSLARTEGFSEVDDGKVGKRARGQTVQHLRCCTGWTLFFRWGRAFESSQSVEVTRATFTVSIQGDKMMCMSSGMKLGSLKKNATHHFSKSAVPGSFFTLLVWWKLAGIHAFPIEDIDKGGLSFSHSSP